MNENHRKKRVTIYRLGLLNIVKVRATLINCGILGSWAGYINVPWYKFRPYRAKNETSLIVAESRPYVLILDGWNTPDPDDIFDPNSTSISNEIVVKKSRYSSCDPRWMTDFDKIIESSNCTILFDHRHTVISKNIDG